MQKHLANTRLCPSQLVKLSLYFSLVPIRHRFHSICSYESPDLVESNYLLIDTDSAPFLQCSWTLIPFAVRSIQEKQVKSTWTSFYQLPVSV